MKKKIYTKLTEHIVRLFEEGKTTKISAAMQWVNENCADLLERPYLSFRSVPGDCWRRGNDYEREALEYTLTDKNGNPLL